MKGQGKGLQLYADKKKEETSISPKWIHQIFKNQDIPLSQMQKIFPEQASFKRLELYDKMYKNRDEDFIAKYRKDNKSIKKNDKLKANA